MNPYNTLESSLFHQHDAHSTPQNNMPQNYHRQALHETTQIFKEFQLPPGAEPMGPPPTQPCPDRLSPQDSLPRGHTEMGEHAMLTPFSMDVQTDESNNPFYSSIPSRSASISPSHFHPLQAPVHGPGHPPISQFPPYSSNNSSRSHPHSHVGVSSQPERLPTPVGANISLLPSPVYGAQAMDPLPPVPSSFSPGHSSTTSFSGFTDPTPWPSSQVHGGGPSAVNFDYRFLSSSPDSTDDSMGPMLSGPPLSSTIPPDPTAPSYIPDHHVYAGAATSSSSSTLGPDRTRRRNGGRRSSEPPRDQRATSRLFGQRRSDDENTEALYKLFVPPGAEVRWKKDRLGIILHYATRFVERYNCLVEYREHNRDAREVQLAQSDEGLNENQEQLDGRHGDLSGQAVHWTTTNDNLERTLTNVEHGLHHQLRISPTDDQHNGAQP